MKRTHMYALLNPLRTGTWKRSKRLPEFNEENYKLYYELQCRSYLGYVDARYPRTCSLREIIIYETPEFVENGWKVGVKKAITYRANMIEENMRWFLDMCEKKRVINWLYEIYDWTNYRVLGYVKAKSDDEAAQLSKLMFNHVIEAINGRMSYKKKIPIWSFEPEESKEIYTELCLKASDEVEKIMRGQKEYIYNLEKKIEACQILKDFIDINMTTFGED